MPPWGGSIYKRTCFSSLSQSKKMSSRKGAVEKTTPSLGKNSLRHPPKPILCTTKRINEFATLLQTIHFNHHPPVSIHGNIAPFHFFQGNILPLQNLPLPPLPIHRNTLPFSSPREYSPVTKFFVPRSSLHGNILPFFSPMEYLPVLLSREYSPVAYPNIHITTPTTTMSNRQIANTYPAWILWLFSRYDKKRKWYNYPFSLDSKCLRLSLLGVMPQVFLTGLETSGYALWALNA